jgi:hypothetical protein
VKAGSHGFDGACTPGRGKANPAWATFSVGIFEWVPKSNGKGLKRGKVKVRVKGPTCCPDLVNMMAAQIAKELDAGTYTGPKTVTVRLPGGSKG